MGHYDCKDCDASPNEPHDLKCVRGAVALKEATPSCWSCVHNKGSPFSIHKACMSCGPHRLNHKQVLQAPSPVWPGSLPKPPQLQKPVAPVPQVTLSPPKPKLLIIGHGRHGKDTVAEILRDKHGFTFASSSYFAAEKVVRPALAVCGVKYDSLEACYADRVNHRAFWYAAISTYNSGGRSRLAEEILKDHDVYVGMRSDAELIASRDMFDLIVWVDASKRGRPLEDVKSFDIQFDPASMNKIDNNGSLEDLESNVASLARALTWSFPKG